MAKILYPVGTPVQIRNWKLEELRDEGHTYDRRKRVVKAYHRGEDRPYELEGMKQRFAVDEIKSFRQLGSNDDIAMPANGTETYSHKTYSREEVDKIVAAQVEAIRKEVDCKVSQLHDHLVEDARLVAQCEIETHQDHDA